MSKRKCTFSSELKAKYTCFESVDDSKYDAFCSVCKTKISVGNKGKYDLQQHIESKKHQLCIRSMETSSKLDSFVSKNKKLGEKVAAVEATLGFHILKHHMSFNSSNCTTDLLKHIFEDSETAKHLSSARTKTAMIEKKVIASYCIGKVTESISNVPFISVSTDASNHNSEKMFPILIQYFIINERICSKMINLETLPNEKAQTICDLLIKTLKKWNLVDKCIAFSADNCNTNFGGVRRAGTENVYSLLSREMQKDLIGIGCPVHIIHNAAKKGLETLSTDVQSIIIKIYNHFSVYTIRTEELREFCEFVNIEYRQLLYHSPTRWLSLFPGLNRVLQMYPALKSYFLSNDSCPKILKNFFESNLGEASLWFAHSIMYNFHEKRKELEAEKNSIIETISILKCLITMLEQRIEQSFLPIKVSNILQTVSKDDSDFQVANFKTEIICCYKTMLNYIISWSCQFHDLNVFHWMSLANVPEWQQVVNAIIYINSKVKNSYIDDVKCFDQYCNLKLYIEKNRSDEFQKMSPNLKWITYFKQSNNSEFYSEILKICQYYFAIPGHNENVERLFSMIGAQWTKERNRLNIESIRSILSITYNYKNVTCKQFYNEIKNDNKLLSKIISSKKYESSVTEELL